jgi:hypothetical protein
MVLQLLLHHQLIALIAADLLELARLQVGVDILPLGLPATAVWFVRAEDLKATDFSSGGDVWVAGRFVDVDFFFWVLAGVGFSGTGDFVGFWQSIDAGIAESAPVRSLECVEDRLLACAAAKVLRHV